MIMKKNTEVNTKNPKTGKKKHSKKLYKKPKNSLKKGKKRANTRHGKKKLNLTPKKQVWPQVTNKCWNIGPQGLQIGFPNSMMVSLYII
jgi:hypothetical protein